jgi:hypothetical protein
MLIRGAGIAGKPQKYSNKRLSRSVVIGLMEL